MKENKQILKKRLKRAVEISVPDILPQLLAQIEQEGVAEKMLPMEIVKTNGDLKQERKTRNWSWQKSLATAAAFIFLFLGFFFLYTNYTTKAVIVFDVNPSLELAINQREKVWKITPRNEEAKTVIGDMKLKGVDLDIAVNALIGSMVRNGYISDLSNSLLITVNSKDKELGLKLKEHLTAEVDSLLQSFSVEGAILSQTSEDSDEYLNLSKKYNISFGKAALIEQLIRQNPSIEFDDAARLTINDLNLLIAARRQKLEGIDSSGKASSKRYIGLEKARQIAFAHAGISGREARGLEIELDLEDGRMIYEVEFIYNDTEYEYEIDAANGQIIEVKIESKNKSKKENSSAENKKKEGLSQAEKYIGKEEAVRIALKDSGLNKSEIRSLEVELEHKSGHSVYEIEFKYQGLEYKYKIDALTGKIIEVEIENESGKARPSQARKNPAKNTGKNAGKEKESKKSATAGNLLAKDKAVSIALNHAGRKRSEVKKLEIELEKEKARLLYEVEFIYENSEYEYQIDAYSGKILAVEIEKLKTNDKGSKK